jgi:predicted transposase YbfD/YdcC
MLFLPWMLYIVKKTLQKIIDNQNHYLVKVKANQPKLLAAVKQTVKSQQPIKQHICKEKNRGRKETRISSIFLVQDNIPNGWPSINRIVFVQREFISKDKYHKTDSYYITDLRSNDAAYLAQGIRSHWFIENKLHYVKDVFMKEDLASTKNKVAAPNLAILRDFTFNILKKENKSIKYASEIFANYNVKDLFNVLIRT